MTEKEEEIAVEWQELSVGKLKMVEKYTHGKPEDPLTPVILVIWVILLFLGKPVPMNGLNGGGTVSGSRMWFAMMAFRFSTTLTFCACVRPA